MGILKEHTAAAAIGFCVEAALVTAVSYLIDDENFLEMAVVYFIGLQVAKLLVTVTTICRFWIVYHIWSKPRLTDNYAQMLFDMEAPFHIKWDGGQDALCEIIADETANIDARMIAVRLIAENDTAKLVAPLTLGLATTASIQNAARFVSYSK